MVCTNICMHEVPGSSTEVWIIPILNHATPSFDEEFFFLFVNSRIDDSYMIYTLFSKQNIYWIILTIYANICILPVRFELRKEIQWVLQKNSSNELNNLIVLMKMNIENICMEWHLKIFRISHISDQFGYIWSIS